MERHRPIVRCLNGYGWQGVVCRSILGVMVISCIARGDTLILYSNTDATWAADVKAKLEATGRIEGQIDVFNALSATPSASALSAYDSILVFSHTNWQNASTLGNRLADYVDNGGGLVISMLTLGNIPVTGRLQSGGYYPILVSGALDGQFTRLTLGTVHEPSSPLMSGVQSLDGGSNSFHSSGGLGAGAKRIADWSNGQPLVATLEHFNAPVVALNFFPVSSDKRSDFWDPTTDGAVLMANALNYTAGNIVPGEGEPPLAVPLPAGAAGGLVLAGLLAVRRRMGRTAAEPMGARIGSG